MPGKRPTKFDLDSTSKQLGEVILFCHLMNQVCWCRGVVQGRC